LAYPLVDYLTKQRFAGYPSHCPSRCATNFNKTWQALPTVYRRHDHGSPLHPSILTIPFNRHLSLAHMTLKPSFMTFPRQLQYLLQQVLDRLDEWFLLALLHFLDVLEESETADRLLLRAVAIDPLRHLELPQTNSNSLQNTVDPGMTHIYTITPY
jgi:hypothetical protein